MRSFTRWRLRCGPSPHGGHQRGSFGTLCLELGGGVRGRGLLWSESRGTLSIGSLSSWGRRMRAASGTSGARFGSWMIAEVSGASGEAG